MDKLDNLAMVLYEFSHTQYHWLETFSKFSMAIYVTGHMRVWYVTRMSRLQCLSWDSKKKKFPKALEEFLHSDRSEEMVSDEYEDSDSD